MILISAVAVLAAGAGATVLLSPGASHLATDAGVGGVAAPLTTVAAYASAIPTVAAAAGRSMVELRVSTPTGSFFLTGVAVAEGGLVATPADTLTGPHTISMVGPGGQLQPASIVAVDRASDLALVTVPDDLPVAPFADDAALVPGSADMTLSLSPPLTPSTAAPALHCTPGSVSAVATPIGAGPADGMAGIESSATGVTGEPGDPLLNAGGAVVGLRDGDGPRAGHGPTFLPTQLVLGVMDDLRSTNRVEHGWLGLAGSDTGAPAAPSGAVVASVAPSGPAAGHLHAGEVVTGVNGAPVRTMAELRARLYVLAPGTTVALSVLDGTMTRVVDVTLSASP